MGTFGYDILKKDSVGAPIWLEAARDLDTAKKRVAELAENSPGEYVVFCEQTSQIVGSFEGTEWDSFVGQQTPARRLPSAFWS
jgi:hypothetical protein